MQYSKRQATVTQSYQLQPTVYATDLRGLPKVNQSQPGMGQERRISGGLRRVSNEMWIGPVDAKMRKPRGSREMS